MDETTNKNKMKLSIYYSKHKKNIDLVSNFFKNLLQEKHEKHITILHEQNIEKH